jgi:hypothetical protein
MSCFTFAVFSGDRMVVNFGYRDDGVVDISNLLYGKAYEFGTLLVSDAMR